MTRIIKSNLFTNSLWLDDITKEDKNKTFMSSNDLLTISCCAHRLKKLDGKGRSLHSFMPNLINQEDETLRDKIIDFYSKKFMVLKLKGIELTKFRKDLCDFISKDFYDRDQQIYVYNEKVYGMVYRLPSFYEYDCEFIDIMSEKTPVTGTTFGKHKLKFLTRLYKENKFSPMIEYWFANEDNKVFRFTYQKENSLVSLLDHVINTHDIIVDGKYCSRLIDGYSFYTPIEYRLSF